MPTARSLAFAQLMARYGSSSTTPLVAFARTSRTGLTGGVPSCLVRQADMLLSFLTFTQIGKRPPSSSNNCRRSPGPALASEQRSRRRTDKLQIVILNPGPFHGSDPRAVADHLNGPWHLICCIQEEVGFANDAPLAENFHVVTQHQCAVLLNKDTSARDVTCSPIQIPYSLRYSSWSVEDMIWLLLASFAGRPTLFAPTISQSPTSTSTMSPPSRGPSALRCYCSSGICGRSSARSCSTATSTRLQNVNSQQEAPAVRAASPRLKLHLATPTFLG